MAGVFSMRNFVKNGLLDGVRSGAMPPWKVNDTALGWYEKGVLKDEDLMEINAAQEEREAEIQRKAAALNEQTEKRIAAETAARSVKALTASAEDAPVALMSVKDEADNSPKQRNDAGNGPGKVPRRPPKGWRVFRTKGGATWKEEFRRRRRR